MTTWIYILCQWGDSGKAILQVRMVAFWAVLKYFWGKDGSATPTEKNRPACLCKTVRLLRLHNIGYIQWQVQKDNAFMMVLLQDKTKVILWKRHSGVTGWITWDMPSTPSDVPGSAFRKTRHAQLLLQRRPAKRHIMPAPYWPTAALPSPGQFQLVLVIPHTHTHTHTVHKTVKKGKCSHSQHRSLTALQYSTIQYNEGI